MTAPTFPIFSIPAALIVAAGKGERAGGEVPKQYALLGGVPVIARAVDAFAGMPVHVVIGEGQRAMLDAALGQREVASVTTGGAERRDSVRAGLATIDDADVVLIHDAARPLLPRAVIDRLLAALDGADGAVPVLPVADTLTREGEIVDRAALMRVQTPQAFRLDAIRAAHDAWAGSMATDDAQVARARGMTVAEVAGDPLLDKITLPADFARAEALLAARLISRSAMGFDVHRFEAGEELWLGGILVPHDRGLSGHSDADVVLHALTDALLGAIGEGDIGSHFSPSDPQWRGARSSVFLAHARDLIRARGARIDYVDVTIICEAPRLAPYREAMRQEIANVLVLHLHSVSVKATTTERLGFAGRGEGIAAQAIATVRVPEAL
ncbi:MAG: bifunctional 2-C-methyl-D-erythritol 4-phosphate cytidylyltransferase/2-C-methyl-D-erythritol 2,4-cyclodiphosphate synthase [Sphingomonadaceae bacterium]|nr:bifunctional 2-C-methyl-D-erythritol 4-phosphate cytidylyltransferase/2-C-methyl-D-erythritol 2,4-cyclodiphosphate synthase [Sphingomonadaceae bacterium]